MKLSRTFILLLSCLLATSGFAADPAAGKVNPHWKVTIENSFGLAQASYSDNWQGGEAGTIIWVAGHRSTAETWLHKYVNWGNELKLEFGQTHTQTKEDKKWQEPNKSADKIRYDGILKYKRGWAVDPYAALTIESQFLDASGKTKKRYLNPIQLTESFGVARDIFNVPDHRVLTTRLGFGVRQLIRKFDDPKDATGNTEKSETTNDGGLEWVTDLALGSAKGKYSFNSKLTVFEAVFDSKSGDYVDNPATSDNEKDYWKSPDVNWDNILRANVTSILQVGLGWQLLYDKQLDLGGRLKQTMTLGLSWKFANFTEEKK
jgi:hypothetical protein